jgi:hypothetical protein
MSEHREFIDGKWMTEDEAIKADQSVCTREEFDILKKQVAEIHEFISALTGVLNSPMIRGMLPPNLRDMLPKD